MKKRKFHLMKLLVEIKERTDLIPFKKKSQEKPTDLK
jgi:hypothetical protein